MRKIIFLFVFLVSILVVSAWDVTITATNQLEPIVFGVEEDATKGYDADFDVYSSTPLQNKVIMSIDEIYVKSYIGEDDELKWNIDVGVPDEQATELKWVLNDVPSNINLFLINNANKINMNNQNSLQLNEGSYMLVVEAKSENIDNKDVQSSDIVSDVTKETSGSSTSSSKSVSIESNDEKTEKDLKLENIPTDANTVKEQKEIEQITTKEEPKNLNFIGISIIIAIIIIGLLIYFVTTKITGGIKNE